MATFSSAHVLCLSMAPAASCCQRDCSISDARVVVALNSLCSGYVSSSTHADRAPIPTRSSKSSSISHLVQVVPRTKVEAGCSFAHLLMPDASDGAEWRTKPHFYRCGILASLGLSQSRLPDLAVPVWPIVVETLVEQRTGVGDSRRL
jgi:hypothetical protein